MITELVRPWRSGHGWSVRQVIIDGHVMAEIVIAVWIGILGRWMWRLKILRVQKSCLKSMFMISFYLASDA